MVLQKRLDYGLNGYQVLVTPRATRSTRRRPTFQRRMEDNQMCAFDLLVTIAGKLLQETSPTSSNSSSEKDQHVLVKEEFQDVDKPLKVEFSDEGFCDRRCFSSLSSQAYDQNYSLKEFSYPENDGYSGIAFIVTRSSCSERCVAETLVDGKSHNKMELLDRQVELGSSGCPEVSGCKFDGDLSKIKVELHKIGNVSIGTGTETCRFVDTVEEKPVLISSVGNTKLSGFIRRGGYYLAEKGMNRDASGSSPRMHEDPGMSSSEAHCHTALQSRDSHGMRRLRE